MISKLILMRHAKSSWKYPDLSDHERPLKKRGRKASVKIAKELIRLKSVSYTHLTLPTTTPV